jgi:hypothetical protein
VRTTWRLAAPLAGSAALGAVLWFVPSGNHSDGGERPSVTDSTLTRWDDEPPQTGHAKTDEPSAGRANIARAAPSQVDAGRPVALTLPSGTTMAIDESATGRDGALQIPADVKRAGWWDGSSRLGDPFGSIVVAAHVDSFTQGLGRIVELLGMNEGDVVEVRSRHLEQRFVVVSARLVPKAAVTARSSIYAPTGDSRLVLITCGGAYDPDTGYAENMVVVAEPAAPPSAR